MANQPSEDFYAAIADEVRADVVSYMGFDGPQAVWLLGMCGEVSLRIISRLRWCGLAGQAARIKLRTEGVPDFSHEVVIANGFILDGSVTQFLHPDYQQHLRTVLPPRTYVFSAGTLQALLGGITDGRGEKYPLGEIVAAEPVTIDMKAIYAGRAYMLRLFKTRFTRMDAEIGTLRPFERAYATGDLEWRRTSAAGLECFIGSREPEVHAFAERMLEDDDDVVRELARLRYEGVRL